MNYYSKPCRVMYRISNGRSVTRNGSYGLIARMRSTGRLIAAWSNSTGKIIA